jgi:hypothetical protein
MSGVVVMNDEVRETITKAVARAREKPTPWVPELVDENQTDNLSKFEDRKPGVTELRQQYPSQHLLIGTYHAAISFEFQPAGLFRHLSVSSRAPGKVPGPEVMQMLAIEFGFSGWPPTRPNRVWMEEYEPKRHAVNVLELEPD